MRDPMHIRINESYVKEMYPQILWHDKYKFLFSFLPLVVSTSRMNKLHDSMSIKLICGGLLVSTSE